MDMDGVFTSCVDGASFGRAHRDVWQSMTDSPSHPVPPSRALQIVLETCSFTLSDQMHADSEAAASPAYARPRSPSETHFLKPFNPDTCAAQGVPEYQRHT